MLNNSILSNLNKGDINSFEHIVNSYERKVYRFIYHMTHDLYVSQDLTQDVFLKVYQNIYKYNNEYPFEPWLFKIAYNTVLNYIKKNKLEEISINEIELDSLKVQDYTISVETRQVIELEIEKLKPENKAIFILRTFQELTFEQIAILLNTSTATVKLRFYRDRKSIVEKIGDINKEV